MPNRSRGQINNQVKHNSLFILVTGTIICFLLLPVFIYSRVESQEAFEISTSNISAPSNLVATVVSSSQINLTWNDNSDNEQGFKIERKTGTGGVYALFATTAVNVHSFSNTGLSCQFHLLLPRLCL